MTTLCADWPVKANQFFADWLTDSGTAAVFAAIHEAAQVLSAGGSVDFDFSVFEPAASGHHAAARIRLPTLGSSASQLRVVERSPVQFPAPDLDASHPDEAIATFYRGLPSEAERQAVAGLAAAGLDLERVEDLFEDHCRLPACFASVFLASRAFTPAAFAAFWEENFLGRSPNERLLRLLAGPGRQIITPHDLTPYVNAISLTHPSLQFLQEEQGFFIHYVDFVVTRIFFVLDPELRGTADIRQFRRADLAGLLFSICQMADVNEATSIFCYQHFYVTFCKFWDLDMDGDGCVSCDDLVKFNDGALSPIICDRFVNFTFAPQSFAGRRVVDFRSFTYLLMCTEDKTNLTSINFWYRLCDLDDDGVLSLNEIARLYAQQFERMGMTGDETIPFGDILRQLIDAVKPAKPSVVTVKDIVASKQAELFFTTLVDLQKFIIREYHAPDFDPDAEELARKLSPWDIYVLTQYNLLVNETA
jgi:serine/threonine-protein phosphatase 2A regulatory subunit B''